MMTPGEKIAPTFQINGGFQLFLRLLAGAGGTLVSALICWMALSLNSLSVDVGRLVERDLANKKIIEGHKLSIDALGNRLLTVEKRSHRHWNQNGGSSGGAE